MWSRQANGVTAAIRECNVVTHMCMCARVWAALNSLPRLGAQSKQSEGISTAIAVLIKLINAGNL